jgi:hypothetical protein
MKIRKTPQSGACGDTVVSRNHHGYHMRRRPARTKPRNKPHTPAIDRSEHVWRTLAALWNSLTEEQYRAWDRAAAQEHTRTRNGERSSLTAREFFYRVNSSRASLGLDPVASPPEQADYCANPVRELVITNRAGHVALGLQLAHAPGSLIKLYASPPQRQGRRKCWDFRVLGALPPAKQGVSDFTVLYVRRFGAPEAGTRVFVRAVVHVDGQQGEERQTNQLIPRSQPPGSWSSSPSARAAAPRR